MSYKIKTTSYFEVEIKRLSKRYRSIKKDLTSFLESLQDNPLQGTEIAPRIRKVRMAISSKDKGKSGGARIITYNNILLSEKDGTIYLLIIYDKSQTPNIKTDVIKAIIKELEL